MNQVPPVEISAPGPGISLKARVAVLAALFFGEKVFLYHFVGFEHARSVLGLGKIVHVAQHWGFRFLVAFAAATVVFAFVRSGPRVGSVVEAAKEARFRPLWALTHVLIVIALVPLSYWLYRDPSTGPQFAVLVGIWTAFAASAVLAAMMAMAPASLWIDGARALGAIWGYAAIAALLGTGTWKWSERLWEPTTVLTFDLVRRVLGPILPTLSADPSTRILGTERFAVEITEVCSGLEGVGLMLAFTAAWLVYFRREYIFPRALVLIPLGLAAMFALNVFRIAALILIGHAGFPDIAAFGFHSQAGWIAFNAVACALVLFSRGSTWLNRTAASSAPSATTDNPTATYLMPLLGILAAGALSRAMSGGFEFFYPLRLIVALAVLAHYWHKLAVIDWRWSWRGPAVGAVIFGIWIVCARFLLPGAVMPEQLTAMPPVWRGTWIASRIAVAVLAVPLAEELAYRGFLMRRLSSADFESVPFRSVAWFPLIVTAVVFGLAHGALWIPGIAAGMAFGLIAVRRDSLGESVSAHITANALIAASVVGAGQWQLW